MDCTCGTEMLAMVPSVALVAMCMGPPARNLITPCSSSNAASDSGSDSDSGSGAIVAESSRRGDARYARLNPIIRWPLQGCAGQSAGRELALALRAEFQPPHRNPVLQNRRALKTRPARFCRGRAWHNTCKLSLSLGAGQRSITRFWIFGVTDTAWALGMRLKYRPQGSCCSSCARLLPAATMRRV